MYDAIVVGGGPAGLSGALTLGRVRRTTLVLDSGAYRNATAEHAQNIFTRDGTPPEVLRRIGREQLAAYPAVEIEPLNAEHARSTGNAFEVRLSDGSTRTARRLLLATGVADELPDIDGLAELWGKGAFHCPYCHGYEVRDQSLAVIGSGERYADLALHLGRLSNDIALCTNGGAELDPDLIALLADQGIAVRAEPIDRLVSKDGVLDRIEFESGEPLTRQAVFTSFTPRQRSALPAQLGCARFDDDAVEVDDFGRTSVSGVYATGDMARRATMPAPFAAVIAAAASGTIAAAALDRDLLAADLGRPTGFPSTSRPTARQPVR
ncbi:MAG TPA: NAD(P)/FAD-dependent oxidoreductase [Nocardioidaceae bacterium]|nr:NAD(P)/FAD-dependent oxidoreductase [Nocardioidaceae bacterium]